MVDFRYHLVSIMAVFLALALGIVVGTTALNGQLLDNLKGSIDALTEDKRTLETTVNELRQQVGSDEQLAEAVGPAAVTGQLTGRRVVLVTAPEAAADAAEQVGVLVQAAGATVTGTVRLRPDLLAPEPGGAVEELLARLGPTGGGQGAADPVQQAAEQLADALLVSPAERDSGSPASASGVLEAFAELDLVDLSSDAIARADLGVLVTGEPVVGPDPDIPIARARALLSVAAALDAAGAGSVVAGPLTATAPGGALRVLRDDVALSEQVSSVDGADRPPGRIAVVFALAEQDEGGAGRYGSGPGSSGPLPSLPVR